MRTHLLSLAPLLLALPVSAATTAELPVEVLVPSVQTGEQLLELQPLAVTALLGRERVELAGFPLSDGSRVDLTLQRLDLDQLQLGFQVDGQPAPDLLDGLDLTVWRGHVADRDDSQAMLSFSQAGASGWILLDGEVHHLMSSGPGEVWMVSESRLAQLGGQRGLPCAADSLPENQARPRPAPRPDVGASGGAKSGSPSLYVCPIAIETDYQLSQVFGGNLSAETAYVTSLITWASYRYEEQIGTVLTYPYVQFYTGINDPWTAQDHGGGCGDLLNEFQAAWAGNVPAGAKIGHFLSGANLGCGVAWLPGLCNEPWNFSVSGNINGGTSFPIQVSPANWDFYVMTHELGHNFGAPHTQDYCPPLDQCVANCTGTIACTDQGAIMSYCHGCPGGVANITTYFHPVSVADMRHRVETTCLPLYGPDPVPYCVSTLSSAGCTPIIGWEGHPTLTGLDDFAVTAELVANNKLGMLIRGTAAASIPFQGGTLCIAPPITRTALQNSGGTAPPTNDCTGTFRNVISPSDLFDLGVGNTIYAQYWLRDPLTPGNVGLSNGLSFIVQF